MDSTKLDAPITTTPEGQRPASDCHRGEQKDLQDRSDSASEQTKQNASQNIIPDDVPRKDGPGGE